MQVDTLGQHVGGDDDVIIVAPFFFVFSIEVGLYGLAKAIAVLGTDGKDVAAVQPLFQFLFQIVDGVDTLAEHHQFAFEVLALVE